MTAFDHLLELKTNIIITNTDLSKMLAGGQKRLRQRLCSYVENDKYKYKYKYKYKCKYKYK